MSGPDFWLTVLLTVAILILPVTAWRFYFLDVFPNLSNKVRLKQSLDKYVIHFRNPLIILPFFRHAKLRF